MLNIVILAQSAQHCPLILDKSLSSRGRFVEQKLMLSSNFRCDQIHNCHCYDFGHTLVC